MTDTNYRWDTVCFAAEHEDPDDLHEKLHQWIAKNFKLNHRGIPLHVMCMAAHCCGFEWHVTDYRLGDTAILLFQSRGSGNCLSLAAEEYRSDILRIVREQIS